MLWVSRPAASTGRWPKAAVANRHPGAVQTALDRHPLVELLMVDEMFDRIQEAFPGPGAEVGTGWPALACGSPGRMTRPPLSPVPSRWPSGASASPGQAPTRPSPSCSRTGRGRAPGRERAAGPRPGPGRPVDREARHALDGRAGVGGMFRRGDNDVTAYVSKAGKALTDLRDLVRQVLREANVAIRLAS